MTSLRYLALEIGEAGITEHVDRRSFVARADVVHIEVRHGIGHRRAILQLGVGFALIVAGLLSVGALAGWLTSLPRGASILTGACVPIVVLGIYIVWFATRPVLYLHVRKRRGTRQFFVDATDIPSLAGTLSSASRRFGYAIRWTIPEPPRTTVTPYRSLESTSRR